MPGPGSVACPKGKTRKQLKAQKDREDAKQLEAFRDAVWRRGWEHLYNSTLPVGGVARAALCQSCGAFVSRFEDELLTGEVHHRIGRAAKTTRHDPDNGVLLCNSLRNDCHGKAQRHEITV